MHDKPKILLATTCRWFSAARLVIAFTRAGFTVEAVSPSNHPILLTKTLEASHPFHSFQPAKSIRLAIEKSRPDIVIPCDDLAAIHLRALYEKVSSENTPASRQLRALVVRSIGDASSYPILASRYKLLALARELGISTPATQEVSSSDDVRSWCAANSFPAVLKADGTSGGQGVRIVKTLEEALAAFRSLRAPAPALVVLKRATIDRDRNLVQPWLQRKRHTVSIQKFVPGRDFNIAVGCWQGEVISTVGAEVLETWRPHGPASVIRLVPSGPMLDAARSLVRRLQLSGLCGFDFLVDRETGEHTLIEINPRATQTAHIPLGPEHDIPTALFSAMTGEAREALSVTNNEEIALFPQAWQSAPPRPHLASAYHDVPWEAPQLVRAGEAETHLLARAKWIQLWMKAWGQMPRLSGDSSHT